MNKKFFFQTSFVSVLPGLISIILSLISIPLFLKILDNSYFGQYLIQNIFLSLGFVLNFGLHRLIIIRSSVKNNLIKIKQNSFYLFLNFILSFSVSIIIMIVMSLVLKNYNFSTLELLYNKFVFLGLVLSSIYFSLDSILRIYNKFYILAIFNLVFNSISFTLPSFYLFYKSISISDFVVLSYPNEIFHIVVFVKLISIIVIYIYLINQSHIKNIFSIQEIYNRNLLSDFKEIFYASLQSLSFFLNNVTDKFFVKLTLGNSFLSIYSIPQQIAAKSTILVTGVSTVFFPEISRRQRISRKKNFFKLIIRISILFTGILNFIAFPFIEPILKLWLGSSFNPAHTILLKCFLFYSFYASINYVISQYIDSEDQNKTNSLIDMSFYLITLFMFVICYKLEILILFALTTIIREFLIFFYKYLKFKSFFDDLKSESILFVVISIFFILGIIYNNLYFYVILNLLLISISVLSVLRFNKKLLIIYINKIISRI